MPQAKVNKEYNTFVRGLITEASPLTFPENASQAEDNFELNRKGYRSRRLGIGLENNPSLINSQDFITQYESKAISCFKWEDVGTDGNLDILVVQVGLDLFFFDATADSVSGTPLNGGNVITVEGDDSFVMQSTVISGNLILITNSKIAYQLQYDSSNDNVTFIQHGLLVRDIWGVNDRLPDSYHITPSDSGGVPDQFKKRIYNLGNQGWLQLLEGSPNRTYLSEYEIQTESLSEYPNNYEQVVSGINTADENRFNVGIVRRDIVGTTLSPRGSYIIDLFERGDSRLFALNDYTPLDNYASQQQRPNINDLEDDRWEQVDSSGNKVYGAFTEIKNSTRRLFAGLPPTLSTINLNRDATAGGIKAVASYGGRVFYAGFSSQVIEGDSKSPNLATYILFSQLANEESRIGKCYQEGDPTSSAESDLVETDGGFIVIPGIGSVLAMREFGRSLLVIANNGVWEIRGGENGFSATDYIVEKVTEVGAVNAESVVVAENLVFYWAVNGIYAISRDQVGLNLISNNITETSIQSFYNDLSAVSKRYAVGVYGESIKKVEWLFNDLPEYSDSTKTNWYNRQLTFDLTLNAFYTYSFASDAADREYPYVSYIYNSPNFLANVNEEQVVVGNDNVCVGVEDVVINQRIISNNDSRTSYMITNPSLTSLNQFSFGGLKNPQFVDWENLVSTPVDAAGFIETGFEVLQDTQRQKQSNYITVHMEKTETGFDSNLEPENASGCLMEVDWDFSNHPNSGKEGQQNQVYRFNRRYVPTGASDTFDYGQSVITTKNRVRGRGRALTMRFTTEPEKNCILYGWSSTLLVNENE